MSETAEPHEDNWRLFASCREYPPDWWFPLPGQDDERDTALRICRQCPVRQRCDDHANTVGERHGIWGGRTSKKRIEELGRTTPPPPRSTRGRRSCGTMSAYRQHLYLGEKPCERCKRANADYVQTRRATRAANKDSA